MAVKKTTEDIETKEADLTSKEYWEEKVPITLPLKMGNPEDQTEFVSVNDKTYQIMRGKEVLVPRNVAEVLKQSQEAETEAFMRRMNMSQEFEAEAAKRLG